MTDTNTPPTLTDGDRTNQERAEHAAEALETYRPGGFGAGGEDAVLEHVGDLICDLLHLANAHHTAAAAVLDTAFMHYSAESSWLVTAADGTTSTIGPHHTIGDAYDAARTLPHDVISVEWAGY